MQDHPGAPGSARQRNSGADGAAACGGAAVPGPKAWDHVRSRAAPMPLAPPGHLGPASADPAVPLSIALSPAHFSRRLQDVLRRVAATPRTFFTYPQSHPNTAENRTTHSQAPNRRPKVVDGTSFRFTARSPPAIIPVHDQHYACLLPQHTPERTPV